MVPDPALNASTSSEEAKSGTSPLSWAEALEAERLRAHLQELERSTWTLSEGEVNQRDRARRRMEALDFKRAEGAAALDRLLLGQCVADVERTPIKWVWRGCLALGKMTMLDGDPGLGKSTIYCDLAARFSAGSAWPDGQLNEERGSVVIVTTEDGIGDTIRPRLEEAGADLKRIRVIQTIPERDGRLRVPKIPRDLDAIFNTCAAIGARLLIIDPLTAHLGSGTDSYKDQDVRSALAPLAEAAERFDVAVLVVRHLNKSGGGKAIYRGGGSIGIIGAARIGLMVGKDPDDLPGDGENPRCVLAPVKNNLGRPAASLAFRIVPSPNDPEVGMTRWEGASSLSANDLCRPERGVGTRSKLEEAISFLEAQLAAGPRLSTELETEAIAHGISKSTLKQARRALGVTASREGYSGDGRWWCELGDTSKETSEPQRGPSPNLSPFEAGWSPLDAPSLPTPAPSSSVANTRSGPCSNTDASVGDAQATGRSQQSTGSEAPF